ncbi:hypothetical protein KEM52_002103 [Ascosphaera acerosa]|nr:hypothetical protein KEM52_002103 [Ascosphaera acerosa]
MAPHGDDQLAVLTARTFELDASYLQELSDLRTLLDHAEPECQLRTESVLCRHDADNLRGSLRELETLCERVEDARREVEVQLSHAKQELLDTRGQWAEEKQRGEELKARLAALRAEKSSNANLLSENLSLKEQITTLRVELQHLQSEEKKRQSTYNENLTLREQATTLQMQLQVSNEALAKARSREAEQTTREQDLRGEIARLNATVERERADKNKALLDVENQRQQSASTAVAGSTDPAMPKMMAQLTEGLRGQDLATDREDVPPAFDAAKASQPSARSGTGRARGRKKQTAPGHTKSADDAILTMPPPLLPTPQLTGTAGPPKAKKQRILSHSRSILEDDDDEDSGDGMFGLFGRRKPSALGKTRTIGGGKVDLLGDFSTISPRKKR